MIPHQSVSAPTRGFGKVSALARFALAAVLLWSAGLFQPVWAIPSPDVIINLTAGLAQVLGVAAALFGGAAYTLRRKLGLAWERRGPERRQLARRVSWITLTVLVTSLAANSFQYFWHLDETNRRLGTNLFRTSKEQGKQVIDVSLKELAFSEQLRHPRGVQPEELQRWLSEGRPLNLIDVRETEEVERGHIHGARHLRYPDVRQNPDVMDNGGGETVLLCYSGNRSGELCDEFTREGRSCRFMIGGYEKWVKERRPLELSSARRPEDLRDIQDYPNKTVLLDTPQAVRLVRDERAVFVDVRYPEDFKLDHLPGALNVTVRKLATDELLAKLQALPHRPVIAPCYDKRSCFYATILGSKLHRLGYDFRGRYTVPQEFYLPPVAPDEARAGAPLAAPSTVLADIVSPLQVCLEWLTRLTGQLALAVLLLVLGLRLLFLPLMRKAERDQHALRALAPRVIRLREEARDNPSGSARAIRALYRRSGLTPGLNLLGTVLQLVVFLALFVAVDRAAQHSTQALLWVSSLAAPDPLHVLPAAIGLLTCGYLVLASRKRGVLALLSYGVGGVLLAVLTSDLRAAVSLYLVANLSLLCLQNLALRRRSASAPAALRPARGSGIVSLRDAHRVAGTGTKAARLGEMMEAGLAVPDGFVITSAALCWAQQPATDGTALRPAAERAIWRRWRSLGAARVAVRSSGLREDGEDHSYAGIFESVLNVTGEGLMEAIATVRASLHSARAKAYAAETDERGAVLVQAMVDAQYAGVLFTEHPASAGCLLVELVDGLAERLVGGRATPQAYRFGRISGMPLDDEQPPLDLSPLIALGRQAEAFFGRPQDIEWAYAAGRFWLLQSRDITASVRQLDGAPGIIERERQRLLERARTTTPSALALVQNGVSELLPRPSPLSLSLMERLWGFDGATDLACRRLGVPYGVEADSPSHLVTVFGALYVDPAEERRRVGRGPSAVAAFRLSRLANRLERDFRERFLPRYRQEVRLAELLDVERLSLAEMILLTERWTRRFVSQTYVEAELVNIAGDFFWKSAVRTLRRHRLDPNVYLVRGTATAMHEAMTLLVDISAGRRSMAEFMERFGHRAAYDYELSEPRFRDNPALVQDLVQRATRTAQTAPVPPPIQGDRILAAVVERARRFEVLKEEAKHHCLRELANLRRLLLALDARLELGGGVFQLTLDELTQLGRQLDDPSLRGKLCALVERRRQEADVLSAVRLPSQLTVPDLERVGSPVAAEARRHDEQTLAGVRVSGQGQVVGRVRVIRSPQDLDAFQRGEILVARFTAPTWVPIFPLARGIVTEVGGWLSHAAIVAREYRLPAIVGVLGVADLLSTGEPVRLTEDGIVQRIPEDEAQTLLQAAEAASDPDRRPQVGREAELVPVHDVQAKVKVVLGVLRGEMTPEQAHKHHGLAPGQVERWVDAARRAMEYALAEAEGSGTEGAAWNAA